MRYLLILFLFVSCSKEKENTVTQNSLSGEWTGEIRSPHGTGGCMACNSYVDQQGFTLIQSGSTVTFKNFLQSHFPDDESTVLNGSLASLNEIEGNWRLNGTFTFNGNNASFSGTIVSLSSNNQICCTYSCSGSFTKK